MTLLLERQPNFYCFGFTLFSHCLDDYAEASFAIDHPSLCHPGCDLGAVSVRSAIIKGAVAKAVPKAVAKNCQNVSRLLSFIQLRMYLHPFGLLLTILISLSFPFFYSEYINIWSIPPPSISLIFFFFNILPVECGLNTTTLRNIFPSAVSFWSIWYSV